MAKNTIVAAVERGDCAKKELLAGEAGILAGHLLTISGGEFVKHATAGQGGDVFVADLDTPKQGDITEAYADGSTVYGLFAEAQRLLNVRIAAAQTIVVGSPLTSNGDGTLRVALTNGTETVLAYAEEASSGAAAGTLIRVRVAAFGYSA